MILFLFILIGCGMVENSRNLKMRKNRLTFVAALALLGFLLTLFGGIY